ncbi:MAG: heavy metal translocating P-type ATPase metal-binding domain-containing protein [Bacteroidota bacterium]
MVVQEEVQAEVKTTCYHCGDDCPDQSIQIAEKTFCCHGCKTVYEILSENDLCDYYDIEQNPGFTKDRAADSEQFAFLDNPTISQPLLEFASENLNKVTFQVPGIHCSSCIWLLENLHKLHPGVIRSQVNFVKKEASISYHPEKLTLRRLADLLDSIGYAPLINLESKDQKEKQQVEKGILLKIGIAGFCFGNIMLLSFPEYLGFDGAVDPGFQTFFNYLNIALSLPVLLYCSQGYFVSAYKGLKQRFLNIDVPIVLGVITLFSRSIWEITTATGPGYLDSLSGLIFFLLIGKWFQSKTYANLSFERDYKSYFPLAVTKLEDGEKSSISVKELKKGDEILIRNNEIIPADAILIDEEAYIDCSFVTGESEPLHRKKGDYIYAGGRQKGGAIRLIVQKPTSQSYLTRLWNNEIFKKESVNPQTLMVNKVSKYFTIVLLGIASVAGVYWYLYQPDRMWQVVAAVLIVACPCALALATPFTLGNVLRVFGKRGFYLKNAETIESVSDIDTIVFDKTGTITKSESMGLTFQGDDLSIDEKSKLKALTSQSTHPLSQSIYHHLGSEELRELFVSDFEEVTGKGISGWAGDSHIKLGSALFVKGRKEDAVVNVTKVHVKIDDQYKGYFEIAHTYRDGLGDLVEELSEHSDLHILSGDNSREQEKLNKLFPQNTEMHFNQAPEDKLNYIRNLQEQGQKVMMIGDGLNDAGALKQSNVGIAVTDNITAFSPACDGILEGKDLNKLNGYFWFSKQAKRIIVLSFIISFLYNIGGLSFAVSGQLTPVFAAILMPLSSISVVAFTSLSVNALSKRKR